MRASGPACRALSQESKAWSAKVPRSPTWTRWWEAIERRAMTPPDEGVAALPIFAVHQSVWGVQS